MCRYLLLESKFKFYPRVGPWLSSGDRERYGQLESDGEEEEDDDKKVMEKRMILLGKT